MRLTQCGRKMPEEHPLNRRVRRGRTLGAHRPITAGATTLLRTQAHLSWLFIASVLTWGATAEGICAQALPTPGTSPDVTIGALSGPDHLLFGRVRGLQVSRDGIVLAVDNMNARVSAFTLEGEFIGDAGRRGQGPGEFIHPRAVAVVEETVYVLDDGRMRFVRFGLGEAGLTFQDEVSLPFTLYDFCAVGEQIIGLGFHEGRPLHAFSSEGELLHWVLSGTFWEVYGELSTGGWLYLSVTSDDQQHAADTLFIDTDPQVAPCAALFGG
jgi:hypothetical protein